MIRVCCDPILMLLEVINRHYGGRNMVVQWSSKLSAAEPCVTVPGVEETGQPWFLMLSTKLPMEAAVLGVVGGAAQVITGEMETPAWKRVCDEIIQRFAAEQTKHKHASTLWGDTSGETN